MKNCKACKEPFEPRRPMQKVCSLTCSIDLVNQDKAKKQRAETREMKKRVRDKDRSYWVKKTQEAFNKWIRIRDDNQPCISCGTWGPCQFHAGHYKTVGGHPALRFQEDNCHKQCSACNNYKSGNLSEYRSNLLIKIGLERVEWLEGPHDPVKYTIEDLQEMLSKYQALNKKWAQSPR